MLQEVPLGITLLLPQDAHGLLGCLPRHLLPDKGRGGITTAAVLAAVHGFYMDQVQLPWGLCQALGVLGFSCATSPLQQQPMQNSVEDVGGVTIRDSSARCAVGDEAGRGESGKGGLGEAAAGAGVNRSGERQLVRGEVAVTDAVWVRRGALLGPCCSFAGLQRLSRDAHSTVYQVNLD
jgi:hypothetical protein